MYLFDLLILPTSPPQEILRLMEYIIQSLSYARCNFPLHKMCDLPLSLNNTYGYCCGLIYIRST